MSKLIEMKILARLVFRIRVAKSRSILKKGSNLVIDNTVRFDRRCFFSARGGKIVIEKNCFLNAEVMMNADIGGEIYVSEGCIVGPRVIFRTANHRFKNLHELKRDQGHDFGDIILEKNVWIGANVTILPNVRIGENSVIGAGSVVTRDIPRNAVALGVPARVSRTLEDNS